jgi:antitoxin HicB
LIEDGMYEAVQARALKRALAEQLSDAMNPDNLSIQLDTLIKAARAVGKTVAIRLN